MSVFEQGADGGMCQVTMATAFEKAKIGSNNCEVESITSNHTSNSIQLYANSGAAQILFFKGDQPEISYSERKGKYQGQVGITLAKSK